MTVLVLLALSAFTALTNDLGLGELDAATVDNTLGCFPVLPVLHFPKFDDPVVGGKQLQ